MDASPTTRGFISPNRSSAWRSRLVRTATATIAALTVAGAGLAVTGGAASATSAGSTAAKAKTVAAAKAAHRTCWTGQLLHNRSFEYPTVTGNGGAWQLTPNNTPGLGWQSLDGNVELWRGLGAPHTGAQHAEINANADRNIIWQAFRTVPRTWVRWSVALKARDYDGNLNWDTTVVRINGEVVRVRTVGDSDWTVIHGSYRVPRGHWISRLSLQSVRHAGGAGYGNLVDTASVRGLRCF